MHDLAGRTFASGHAYSGTTSQPTAHASCWPSDEQLRDGLVTLVARPIGKGRFDVYAVVTSQVVDPVLRSIGELQCQEGLPLCNLLLRGQPDVILQPDTLALLRRDARFGKTARKDKKAKDKRKKKKKKKEKWAMHQSSCGAASLSLSSGMSETMRM